MSSFTSRTVIAAFANIEETILAVHATKLMLTEKQRRMTKDAMNAAELRAKELCSYLGYNPYDVYLQENLHRVDLEQKDIRDSSRG
jgi:hypothetical protein